MTRDPATCASTITHRRLALAVLLGLAAVNPGHAAEPAPAAEVTLPEALALAFRHSPRLAVDRAEVAAARARVVIAAPYPFNPRLEIEGAARIGPDDTTTDLRLAVAQDLELGGRRGHHGAAAEAELAAVTARAHRAAELLAADVRLAFLDALTARERLAVAEAELTLATTLRDLAEKRLAAGAGTQLDVNVAIADRGQADLRMAAAQGEYGAARVALAQAMGLPAPALPAPAGDLVTLDDEAPPALPVLLERAEGRRADLRAFQAQALAAEQRLQGARAGVWPALGVRVFGGREEGTDTLIGAGIELPLPVFDRNQGEVAEALGARRRVEAAQAAARLDVLHEVVAAHLRHEAAAAVVRRLRESVVGTHRESLELIEKSYAAGKATWIEVLVTRNALFDAQRALIEAAAAAHRARVQLDVAAGQIPVPAGLFDEGEGP